MKIEVDSDLEEVLKARSEEKDFETTEEYVNHLLEQVVEKIRREQGNDSYSSEKEEEVKKRLEDLGYTG